MRPLNPLIRPHLLNYQYDFVRNIPSFDGPIPNINMIKKTTTYEVSTRLMGTTPTLIIL